MIVVGGLLRFLKMQKIVKTIIFLIFLFILSVFFISLNRDTNYNTAIK